MRVLILSYFDDWEGPKIFLQHPETKYQEELKQIPQLMNLYDKGFFTHSIRGFTSANLIFDLPSNYIRGGSELLQITILLKDEFINTDLSKELLQWFVDQLNDIDDVYKAFYPESDEKIEIKDKFVIPYYASSSKDKKGNRGKLAKVQDLFFNVFYNLPKESITIRRSDSKIFVFGLSRVGKTTIIKVIQGYQKKSTIPTFNVDVSQILFNNISLITYDAPGQAKFQNFWKPYLKNLNGLVFVLDITDQNAFPQAREILHSIANKPNLRNLPLLIIYNKIDLMTPDVEKIKVALDIDDLGERACKYFLTSGLTNEGIVNAFTWLTTNILGRRFSPVDKELGIIFSRWDEIIGLKILTTYPESIIDDPEHIALKCFSISQFVFEGDQVKKSAFILPLPQLSAKAAIYYDYVQDTSVRGNRLPLSLILIFHENIPNSIIDKFNSLVEDKFELIKKRYVNEENFEKYFTELHGTIRERLNSFKSTVKELRVAELQYKALFKAARDAILIIDQKAGIIIDTNEQAENFFLLPLEKIIGSHMTKLKFDVEYDEFKENMANQVSLEGAPPFEAVILNSEEFSIPVEINASGIQMGGRNYIQCIIRDVTERNKAEQRVRESERRYRLISENANDLIIVLNNKFEQEYINEGAYTSIMGYTKGDVVYKSALALIHPDDQKRCTQALIDSLKKGGGRVDARFKHKDGHYLYLGIKGRPYFDKDGKRKLLLIGRDITEQKKSESIIQKNLMFEITIGAISSRFIDTTNFDNAINETLRDIGILCGASRSYIYIRNENGKTIRNSHLWCAKGLNAEFQNLRKVPTDVLQYWEQILIENGYIHIKDLSMLKAKDKFLKERLEGLNIGSLLIFPIYVKNNLEMMIGFDNVSKPKEWKTEDFTVLRITSELIGAAIERKRSEELLEESEEKYRLISENAYDMITILNDKFEYEYINEQTFFKVVGLSNEDMIGKSSLLFVHPEDIRKTSRNLRKGFKTGVGADELRFRKKDGNYIWIEVKGSTFINKDKELKALIISRDISERKKAEQRIRESEIKYRQLYENSPEAIVITNKNGVILECNSATEYIFGFKKSEIIGKNYGDFGIYNKEQTISFKDRYVELLRGNTPEPIEIQIRRKNGSLAWIYYQSSLIKLYDEYLLEAIMQDISQQKYAEQLLKESEEKYRLISETAYDLIGILNKKFKYEYINEQAFKQILGYSNEDLIGKSALKFTHPDDVAYAAKALREGFKEGTGGAEIRFKHKNGKWVWIEAKGKTYYDKDGDLKAIIISRDISERKITEKKIKESEEKYRLISENANDLIRVLNDKFEFEYINETVHKRLLGYSREDIIGKAHLPFFHPEDRKHAALSASKNLRKGKGSYHARFRDKYGGYKWFEFSGKIFYDSKGDKKILSIARDITDRKKTEQMLKQSEEKYRMISENANDLIFILGNDAKFIYCNEAFNRILGYNPEELIGTLPFDLSHPEDLKHTSDDFKSAITHGTGGNIARFKHKDGGYRWVESFGKIIYDEEGNYSQMFTVSRDITERKITEQKLHDTEKNLRERVKELTSLFGISQIIEEGNISIEEILFGILNLITSAWQFPHLTCVKIAYGKIEYSTENFKETSWKLSTKVQINEKLFMLEIYYLEDIPFLGEEKSLIRDVTNRLKLVIEQKEAEQKLKASEEKYRDLVNSITDLLLEVDLKGKITYVSPQIYDMFGFTVSEIQNKRIRKFIHPEDLSKVLETMKEGFETKKNMTLEYRTRHKDGHYVHASVKGTILDNGRFYGVVRDISERKIAEHKFRSLLETSPIGIIELNLQTMLIDYINPKLREAIGLNLVELNQKRVNIDNFDLSNNTTIEFKIYNSDGLIWLTGKKILQHNRPGELKSAIIWIEDISNKKKVGPKYEEAASSISLR